MGRNKSRVRRTIADELDKEFAKLQNKVEKELNWRPPIKQVSIIAAGIINSKKIKLNKVSRKSWEVELI